MNRLRVVVLGGSFGGLMAAYHLRKSVPRQHDILVVSNSSLFVFRPALPFVALGRRESQSITAELRPALERRGIAFCQATVKRIDPGRRLVITTRGEVEYDYVVVALGAHLHREAVAGLDANAECIMWLDDALRVRERLKAFSGGDVAILEVQESPAPCPAYELAFGLDAYLRERGLREKSRIHFVSYADTPFAGAGEKASHLVARELARRGIAWHGGAAVAQVQGGGVYLEDGRSVPADLILAFPPYRGTRAVVESSELGDAQGFIPVAPTLESIRFPRVFVAGDAGAFRGPKTGRLAMLQAKVAAHNIACQIAMGGRYMTYRPHLLCAMDMGAGRGLLVYSREDPGMGPPRSSMVLTGRWPAAMKFALERYFMATYV